MTDETVVTVTEGEATMGPGQIWSPIEGEETGLLVSHLNLTDDEKRLLVAESVDILSRCTDPNDPSPSRRAGLVVGEVQSGKTLSFTTVAALARDNGYQLVILLAGTKQNLLDQSRDRLADDLSLRSGDTHYRWTHHLSPKPDNGAAESLAADLRHALDGTSEPDEVATVLVTVMKNHRHMQDAAAVLRQVATQIDLSAITALVIDDEADQASPNVRRTGESATYRNLREIRDPLPRHTLLEYTATPQAPLLASIADELSPDFTFVLTAGPDYTGGHYFFEQHRDAFLEIIPAGDLACLDNPSLGPPESLLNALALFFVGAAASQLDRSRGRVQQRSMLVHPSQATLPHGEFRTWIESTRRTWVQTLGEEGPDRADLIARYLRPAYDDLVTSVASLADWPRVLGNLQSVMDRARIEEVNTRGRRPDINWSQRYAWILVGGAMLDRGFTVEGLIVTYIPRGVGTGQADTVQQRARFFGYKRPYGGYCRAWLEADVADAFTDYVAHEEAMRADLRQVASTGEPLKQWRRRFLLDPALRLTRQAAIRLPMTRWNLGDSWFQQWHVPLPPQGNELIAHNQQAVENLCSGLDWALDPRVSGTTKMERHNRADVSLREAFEGLLIDLTWVETDHARFWALLLSLEELLSRGSDPGCAVYLMSQGESRERSLEGESTRLGGLLSGRSHDRTYAGDRSVRDDQRMTMQIHMVNVQNEGQPKRTLVERVPFLAVYVPAALDLESVIVER